MTTFTISLAGFCVEINAIHNFIYTFCRKYLCEGTPNFSITVFPEDLANEQEKCEREEKFEGIPCGQYPTTA